MSYVFISYSRVDIRFAKTMVKSLEAQNHDTWIDYRDLDLTLSLETQLAYAIEKANKLLLISSTHSQASVWVDFEITLARSYRKTIDVICIPSPDYISSANYTSQIPELNYSCRAVQHFVGLPRSP